MRVIEDILLSERDGGSEGRGNGHASRRSESGTGRVAKWHTRKCGF
jgi:hypothetical protein